MKRIALSLLFSAASAVFAGDLESGFVKVETVYRSADRGAPVRFGGVGTLLESKVGEKTRYFVVTVSHLTSGGETRVSVWDSGERLAVKSISSDSLNDLAVIEIERPEAGSKPLLSFRGGRIDFTEPAKLVELLKDPSMLKQFRVQQTDRSSAVVFPRGFQTAVNQDEGRGEDNLMSYPSLHHRYTDSARYTRSFRIHPGMSGSLFFQFGGTSAVFKGLASQYDRIMIRSFFAPVAALENLLKSVSANGTKTDSVRWKLKGCYLYRHFTEPGYLESDISSPAGGAGYGDGGGAGYGDGGDCGDESTIEKKLSMLPGFVEERTEKNIFAFRFSQALDRRGSAKSAYFMAHPDALAHFKARPFQNPEAVDRPDLLDLLKTKVAMRNGKSFHSDGEALLHFARETFICPGGTEQRDLHSSRTQAAVSLSGARLALRLPLNGCSVNDELDLEIALDTFTDKQSYAVNRWLVVPVISKNGHPFYVDLRNFWFSHPESAPDEAVIQVKPADASSKWWSYLTLSFR